MAQQQGIIGDSVGTDLPVSSVDQMQLDNEKKMARFSKTEEFKRLKGHLEDRIKFYQSYLPDGRAVAGLSKADIESKWIIANAIIGEFKSVLQAYELAAEAVKDAR